MLRKLQITLGDTFFAAHCIYLYLVYDYIIIIIIITEYYKITKTERKLQKPTLSKPTTIHRRIIGVTASVSGRMDIYYVKKFLSIPKKSRGLPHKCDKILKPVSRATGWSASPQHVIKQQKHQLYGHIFGWFSTKKIFYTNSDL